jgi:hypothetical protein
MPTQVCISVEEVLVLIARILAVFLQTATCVGHGYGMMPHAVLNYTVGARNLCTYTTTDSRA